MTDQLLAEGWRHFGEHFFRYNLGIFNDEIRRVYALRIDLSRFSFSKSQRRTLNRNNDLETVFRPAAITAETIALFELHKHRFSFGVPESIFDFMSAEPAMTPNETLECAVLDGGRLVATSFFDVGSNAVSSIYGMFDPSEVRRRLGILTMLREIEFALEHRKKYYYHGYIYEGNSFYDYKRRFRGLEVYDWQGSWVEYTED